MQEVLRDVPDFNERAKVLQNHKNKLEALLSPTLVQIFNKHDLGKIFINLFVYLSLHQLKAAENIDDLPYDSLPFIHSC